jgi:hypothetical protein
LTPDEYMRWQVYYGRIAQQQELENMKGQAE